MVLLVVLFILLFPSPSYGEAQVASWYGPGKHGRGGGCTAVHSELPVGTKLLVCYRYCTDVRVIQHDPLGDSSNLHLSRRAANSIGLISPHPDTVWVEVINEVRSD